MIATAITHLQVVHAKEHERFKRIGTDLVMEKPISLAEALCGTTFTIQHLDDRTLRVTTKPGEVQSGCLPLRCVGMSLAMLPGHSQVKCARCQLMCQLSTLFVLVRCI